jgi:hypothetical protein
MKWSARFLSAGSLVHAVPDADDPHRRALCNMRPSYSHPGWQDGTAAVTCQRCLHAVAKLEASTAT